MISTGLRDHTSYMQVYYYPDKNFYVDQFGEVINCIFEILTPNDIFLFKDDPGHCMFQHRGNPDIIIEIIECIDTTYNQDKENFYETRYNNSNYRGCVGRRCEFFDNDETSKQEICSACQGGS